jgi:hypothetical protein
MCGNNRLSNRCRSVALSGLISIACAVSHGSSSVEEIRAAWKHQQDESQSLHLSCSLLRTELKPASQISDPFAKPTNPASPDVLLELHGEIEFNVDGPMLAFTRNMEFWDQASKLSKEMHRVVFDGSESRSLLPGKAFDMGRITDGTSGQLQTLELDGVWLWWNPEYYFKVRDADIERMSVNNAEVNWNGRSCIGLTVPMTVRPSGVTAQVYLDRESLNPIRIAMLVKSALRHETEISRDANGLLSGWKTVRYGASGKPFLTIVGTTREAERNVQIDRSVFQMEFPAETHYAKGDNFYIRGTGSEAEDKELTPREFVAVPGNELANSTDTWPRVFIGINIIVFVVILAIVLRRHVRYKSLSK